MDNKYIAICEKMDWTVNEYDDYIELEKHSPAGEDFSFTVEKNDFIDNVKEYSAHFDIDEHIEMWIEARKTGTSGVPSTRELVKDAEDIDKMLQELSTALFASEEDKEK